jgi:anaerobic magnesium-protoporphyrin IX monomethyl ester cyclase
MLAAYDGDYLNAMYVTPHSWTQFAREQAGRPVVQEELGRWDYRHQVLAQRRLRPWQLFAAVKWLELRFHLRPRRLRRLLLAPDRRRRREAWWTARHTGLVWLLEIVEFVRRVRFTRRPRPLAEHLSAWTGSGVSGAARPGTVQAEADGADQEVADHGSLRSLQQRLLARF